MLPDVVIVAWCMGWPYLYIWQPDCDLSLVHLGLLYICCCSPVNPTWRGLYLDFVTKEECLMQFVGDFKEQPSDSIFEKGGDVLTPRGCINSSKAIWMTMHASFLDYACFFPGLRMLLYFFPSSCDACRDGRAYYLNIMIWPWPQGLCSDYHCLALIL